MSRYLAAFGAILVASAAAASPNALADWVQDSADAARTGQSADGGPRWPDVAFRVRLPGSVYWSSPLILDGSVYVMLTDLNVTDVEAEKRGIYRVNLSDASTTLVAAVPPPTQGYHTLRVSPGLLATDGTLFFVVDEERVHAFTLDGESAWSLSLPITPEGSSVALCSSLAVRNGKLFAGCSAYVDAPDGAFRSTAFVARIDIASHSQDWVWLGAMMPAQPPAVRPQAADAVNQPYNLQELQAISIIGDKVLVNIFEKAGELMTISGEGFGSGSAMAAATGRVGTLALDEATGRWVWARWSPFQQIYGETPGVDPVYVQRDNLPDPGQVTGAGDTVYVKDPAGMVAVNLDDGTPISKVVEFGGGNSKRTDNARAMALSETMLYAAKGQSLTAFRLPQLHPEWSLALDSATNETFSADVRILAGDLLFATSYHFSGYHEDFERFGSVYAIDAASGKVVWSQALQNTDNAIGTIGTAGTFYHALSGIGYRVAVGEGVLVAASTSGDLVVFGPTPASLKPVVVVEKPRLLPREAVVIDLSATRPGVHGPAEAFRVDWGDGTRDDWDNGSRRDHTYATAGNYTLRVEARNAAGQTSTDEFVLGVVEPEVRPGIFEVAFTEKNQNLTFFLIGLGLTGGGGVTGFIRVRRKGHRLRDELHAVEAAHARTAQDPSEAEAALRERREHARLMLSRGRLDETQFGIVERRIDELRGVSQMTSLVSMVDAPLSSTLQVALDRIVADRRVTPGERASFSAAVQAEPSLTPTQKAAILLRLKA